MSWFKPKSREQSQDKTEFLDDPFDSGNTEELPVSNVSIEIAQDQINQSFSVEESFRELEKYDGSSGYQNELPDVPMRVESVKETRSLTVEFPVSKMKLTNVQIGIGCGIISIVNGCQGMMVGGLMGAVLGFMEAQQHQLAKQEIPRFVKSHAWENAKLLGIFASVSSGTSFGLQQMRGKDDLLNSFISGASAGVAVSTLLWRNRGGSVFKYALMSGAFNTAYEAYQGKRMTNSSSTGP